jgi:hypothetical protein
VGTTHHVHIEDSRPSVAIRVLEDPMLLQHFNVSATKLKYQNESLSVEEKKLYLTCIVFLFVKANDCKSFREWKTKMDNK